MRAAGEPARKLTDDVTAVKWLPLQQAIDTLTRPHEKAFLMSVGEAALQAVEPSVRETHPAAPLISDNGGVPKPRTFLETIRGWLSQLAQT